MFTRKVPSPHGPLRIDEEHGPLGPFDLLKDKLHSFSASFGELSFFAPEEEDEEGESREGLLYDDFTLQQTPPSAYDESDEFLTSTPMQDEDQEQNFHNAQNQQAAWKQNTGAQLSVNGISTPFFQVCRMQEDQPAAATNGEFTTSPKLSPAPPLNLTPSPPLKLTPASQFPSSIATLPYTPNATPQNLSSAASTASQNTSATQIPSSAPTPAEFPFHATPAQTTATANNCAPVGFTPIYGWQLMNSLISPTAPPIASYNSHSYGQNSGVYPVQKIALPSMRKKLPSTSGDPQQRALRPAFGVGAGGSHHGMKSCRKRAFAEQLVSSLQPAKKQRNPESPLILSPRPSPLISPMQISPPMPAGSLSNSTLPLPPLLELSQSDSAVALANSDDGSAGYAHTPEAVSQISKNNCRQVVEHLLSKRRKGVLVASGPFAALGLSGQSCTLPASAPLVAQIDKASFMEAAERVLSSSKKQKHFLPPESVKALKTWFFDHFEHPYPTTEEKENLCSETGLTYLQVSNWFTNTRKRVWAPSMKILANGELSRMRQFVH